MQDIVRPVKVLGRYALFEQIASGGMATVHIGRLQGPVGFARTVAIKRLHQHLSADPEFVSMFLEEARLAARIQHANVVATLDVVTESGELFLVMEYVDGESLARLLSGLRKRKETIPLPVLGAIVSHCLFGLHAAHEAKSETGQLLGIVHRDVSPENVMVGRDGSSRVLDFGVAKATERGRMTQAGKIKGKIHYMAPEQVKGDELDRRVDIYATSVMLWEAITGRRLHEGGEVEVMYRIIQGNYDPPSKYARGVPPELDELVMKGLARDRDQRWATAREMAQAVEAVLGVSSPTRVAELVEQVAGEALSERARIVKQVETSSDVSDVGHHQTLQAHPGTEILPAAKPAPRARMPSRPDAATMAQYELPDLGDLGGNAPAAKGDPKAAKVTAPMPRATVQGLAPLEVPSLDLGGPTPAPAAPPPPAPRAPSPPPSAPLSASRLSSPALEVPAPAPPPAASPFDDDDDDDDAPKPNNLEIDLGAISAPSPSGSGLSIGGPGPASAPRSGAGLQAPQSHGGPPRNSPATGLTAASPRPSAGGGGAGLAVAGVAGVLILGVVGAVLYLRQEKKVPPSAPATAAPTASGPPPSTQCEAARTHLRGGGKTTGLSLEGWALELWLRASDRKLEGQNPFVQKAIVGGRPTDPALAGIEGQVQVDRFVGPLGGKPTDEGLVIRFTGPLAAAAFEPSTAARFVAMADTLFETTGADAGALVGRCEHVRQNEFGLWYRAKDPKAVGAAVIFTMQAFNDVPLLPQRVIDPSSNGAAKTSFDALLGNTVALPEKVFVAELEREAGTATIDAKRGMRLTFPASEPSRAGAASRVLMDKLQVLKKK